MSEDGSVEGLDEMTVESAWEALLHEAQDYRWGEDGFPVDKDIQEDFNVAARALALAVLEEALMGVGWDMNKNAATEIALEARIQALGKEKA